MKKTKGLLIFAACLAIAIILAGCEGKAGEYAKEARSTYVSARAVLVGVQEFPSEMEELLRSESLDAIDEQAKELVDATGDLISASSSALEDCKEQCQLLKNEGSRKYDPYADKMLELVGLNEQLISSYSELISISRALLDSEPYRANPETLMPGLNQLDKVAVRIQEQRDLIHQLEEEAEQLYLSLTA
jgi:hypothetical protein